MSLLAKNSPKQCDSDLLIAVAAGEGVRWRSCTSAITHAIRFLSRFTPRYETSKKSSTILHGRWQSAGLFAARRRFPPGFFGIAYRMALKSLRRQRTMRDEASTTIRNNPSSRARHRGSRLGDAWPESPSLEQRLTLLCLHMGHSLEKSR